MERTRMTFVMLLLAMLSACARAPVGGAPPALVGTEWQLVELGGAPVLAGVNVTLAFPESGRVAGLGSCNRFFGTYTLVQDRIAIGQLGSTRIACDGPVSTQEHRYLAALQKARQVRLEGNTLVLQLDGDATPLRFARSRP